MNRSRYATPNVNATSHTVDYTIAVQPGPVFHMGVLSLVNLNDQRLRYCSTDHCTQTMSYDAILVPQFLLRYKNQLHALDGWSATYKAFEHEDTHLVDLVLTFRPGRSLY